MTGEQRATIGLKGTTKARLDKNRAPGQCYDGFIRQLVDLWEESQGRERLSKDDLIREVVPINL